MPPFEILIKTSFEKDLASVPRESVLRILEKIEDLYETPIPHGARKLSGTDYLYRIRVGEYRVIYEVRHQQRLVILFYVRHRRSAYRGL